MLSNALKRYESTEVDRRTWLYVQLRTLWSTSTDTHQAVEIWKETSTYMYTHFKSDLINNMDNIRISGTESSSVILSQQSRLKSWQEMFQKCQIKLKPNGMV